MHSSTSASDSSTGVRRMETSSSDSPLLNFFSSILSFCALTALVMLAIEAWCLSKASLSHLAIISSVFFVQKLKALSFSLSSLIIFSILKIYLGVIRYQSRSRRRCQVLEMEKRMIFLVSNVLVGCTTYKLSHTHRGKKNN